MKKLILALVLLSSVGTATSLQAKAAPKHRYQVSVSVDDVADSQKKSQTKADDEAIEAYSDTTAVDTAAEEATDPDESYDSNSNRGSIYSPSNYTDPFDYFGSLYGKGAVTFFIVVLVILGLLITIAPIIIVFLLIRYLLRRHDDKVRMETVSPVDRTSNEYYVCSGLRNAFLGLALCVMFLIWEWNLMAGVAAFIFIYGFGKVVIGNLPAIKKYFQHKDEVNNEAPDAEVE